MSSNYDRAPAALEHTEVTSLETSFINRVYGWMTFGLAVTGLIAYFTASSPAMTKFCLANQWVYMLLLLAELGVVVALTAAIKKINAGAATFGFLLFAILNGLTLSVIFLSYEMGSIAATFFATSGTFGVMSLYGYMTKKDLTGLGSLCFMGLIGIIIASVINMFIGSARMDYIISIIGILVFVGLTAYDTQKIKQLATATGSMERDDFKKAAIIGALALYLDFINLFLFILRIFGNRR